MWVIGDVHGQFNTLMKLFHKLEKQGVDTTKETFFFVGDLIDRGLQSFEVVELVMNSSNMKTVIGNHEHMSFTSDFSMWGMNGGINTIVSHIREHNDPKILEKHIKWFMQLPIILEVEKENSQNILISHSSCADFKLGLMNKEDCMWNRVNYPKKLEQLNVFGHTHVKNPVFKEWWINIDTGCGKGKNRSLTALNLETFEIVQEICEEPLIDGFNNTVWATEFFNEVNLDIKDVLYW